MDRTSKSRERREAGAASKPLAIVGMACLFPKADGLAQYWSNIRDGVDAITEIPATHWDPKDYFDGDPSSPDRTYAQRGGFLSSVDFAPLEHGIAPKDIEATDTSQLLGMVAAQEALRDAGYGPGREFDRNRVGVILGVTGTLELVIPLGARLGHPIWRRALQEAGVDEATSEKVVEGISGSYVGWQENSFPGLLGNVVAGRIASRLDVGGTNCVVDAACASSLGALHLGALELETGRADMVVTGGVDTFNDIFMYMCFSKTPALSATGNARPFDKDADGTIIGEGLGLVVLKRLEDAERDGDRIHAVLRGIGSSSDGKGNAVYAPSARGQAKALRAAYDRAGVTPDTIELVEAHGTGTVVGDATEVTALTEVYREHREQGSWCALGSVKSQIGHTKAAAGIAGLIKAALGLEKRVLPPTIKVRQPHEKLASGETPFYVNADKRPWLPREHPRRAAISSFGFGGSNYHCVLEEHAGNQSAVDWEPDTQILAFATKGADELTAVLDQVAQSRDRAAFRSFAVASRKQYDPSLPHRLLFVSTPSVSISQQVESARRMLQQRGSDRSWATPDGVFYGHGNQAGKLAVLFPGQGAQYVGMLRDLVCQFPVALETLAAANEAFWEDSSGDVRLSDLIYPPSAFSDEERATQETDLRSTQVAQPAIGAVTLGAWKILADFGVTPELCGGHSYGEIPALHVAGRITETGFHSLSNFRGRFMGAGVGDRGSMLAVQAPLDLVENVLRDEGLDLVIANRNAPRQAVLSGASQIIEQAAAAFEKLQIRHRRLDVAAAFHSPFVADAREPFRKALGKIKFRDGQVPVFSNTTAEPYPNDVPATQSLLAGQLAEPVEFVRQVENLYRSGARVFLEVGPSARLTSLVGAILGDQEHHAVALDASSGKRSGMEDLARTLAQLSSLGVELDLTQWAPDSADPAASGEERPKFTVPVCGANQINAGSKPNPPKPVSGNATSRPAQQAIPANSAASANSKASTSGVSSTPPVREQRPPAVSAPVPSSPQVRPAGSRPVPPQATHKGNAGQQPPSQENQPVTDSGQTPSTDALTHALRATQENLVAIQRMQEQTARVHQQFLEGQGQSLAALQRLMEQQQALYTGAPMPAPLAAAPIAPAPAPVAPPTVSPVPAAPVVQAPQPQAPSPAPVAAAPVVPAPTPQAGPEPVSATPVQPDSDVAQVLLEVVAEKTGYPVEMLNVDMELDTDLGIDSIKRVEILSSLQERLPELPAVQPEQLGALQTLGQIVAVMVPAAEAPVGGGASASAGGLDADRVAAALLEVVAEKTGYPPEMLNLEMELDSDLGIDSIKRVEILSSLQERLPEAPAVQPEQLGTLGSLQQIVEFLSESVAQASGTAAPAAAAVPAASPPSSGLDANVVATTLIEIIAEKTGYPSEMLNLDMQLDADLGIDSIKRVEILSSLQERLPEAPAVQPEHLGELGTLRAIVDFLGNDLSGGNTAVENEPVAPTVDARVPEVAPADEAAEPEAETIQRSVVSAVGLGRPPARRKVSLPENSLFWISEEGGELSRRVVRRLEAIGFRAELVSIREPGAVPEDLRGVMILAPREPMEHEFLADSLFFAQATASALRKVGTPASSVFVTVSRLDGSFGFAGLDPLQDPISGGLAALTKTVAKEWSEVASKALDLAPDLDDLDELARMIVEEALLYGPEEVGLSVSGRVSLQLQDSAIAAEELGELPVGEGDVVLVTGGARGVTAECALELARACRPTLVLFGRSAEPEEEPLWLAGLEDEAAIKRALLEHMDPEGDRSPRALRQRYERVVGQREMTENFKRLEAAGARVVYASVDVTDRDQVRSVLEEVEARYGPVRGVVHGAGVLADQAIEQKDRASYDRVYGTKVHGAEAILEVLGEESRSDEAALRFLVFFSSTTARLGRVGQVDYAIANEVLNKMAQQFARTRPACRVLTLNWGPWAGGMVSPELARLFAEEGIDLIPLRAGARALVDELRSSGEQPVEVVFLGGTPELPGPDGVVEARVLPGRAEPQDANLILAFERTMSLETEPFLKSHVLDGRAVLPMALMVEWLAHGALHHNPGLRFQGFEDLRVLKGVILDPGDNYPMAVHAERARSEDGVLRSWAELRGTHNGQQVVHARAEVLLASQLPSASSEFQQIPFAEFPHDANACYGKFLFHGSDFQGIERVAGCDERGIEVVNRAAPRPSEWLTRPLRQDWLADPLILDGSFQAMILWSFQQLGKGSLPCFVQSYRQFRRAFPDSGAVIRIQVTSFTDHAARADIEFYDRDAGDLIARIQGYECVIDASLRDAFRNNQLTVS